MRRMIDRIRNLALIVTLCGGWIGVAAAQSEQQPQPQPNSTAQSEQQPAPADTPPPKPKAKRVFTNDDIPSSPDADKAPSNNDAAPSLAPSNGAKLSAEEVRAAIRKQKGRLAEAQSIHDKLQKLSDQLPKSDCRYLYYPDDPTRNVCADFTKIPSKLKQAQSRVDKEQSTLDLMKDQARKMGYGSSVYDPN